LNANFRGKGASPTNDFWNQKSRVPELSYGEKNCRKVQPPEEGAPTSQTTDKQTDRQTDRQTDGRLIAYSERNVVRSLKTLRMARVNEGSYSFTCHPRVYP